MKELQKTGLVNPKTEKESSAITSHWPYYTHRSSLLSTE